MYRPITSLPHPLPPTPTPNPYLHDHLPSAPASLGLQESRRSSNYSEAMAMKHTMVRESCYLKSVNCVSPGSHEEIICKN